MGFVLFHLLAMMVLHMVARFSMTKYRKFLSIDLSKPRSAQCLYLSMHIANQLQITYWQQGKIHEYDQGVGCKHGAWTCNGV